MKKILLTIASFALAIVVNAQVSVTQQNISVIENNPNITQHQHSQVVSQAPKKISKQSALGGLLLFGYTRRLWHGSSVISWREQGWHIPYGVDS